MLDGRWLTDLIFSLSRMKLARVSGGLDIYELREKYLFFMFYSYVGFGADDLEPKRSMSLLLTKSSSEPTCLYLDTVSAALLLPLLQCRSTFFRSSLLPIAYLPPPLVSVLRDEMT